jgi:tetratricopeptide (TPR) repeat protein
MSNRLARRVALIGWDAADWKMIHPLLDRGLLPNLQSIVERGVMGNLSTLVPAVPPLLWTSIATGHTADRHGVLGFADPEPMSGALRPVGSTARKSKALWNILSQSGLRSLVVNWFASHPAEPIRGAVVSNAFRAANHVAGSDWPLPPSAVHPPEFESALAEFRISPADLTGDDLAPFIPRLAEIDQDQDQRPLSLATFLAENISAHAAATWLVETQEWDFLAVYYDLVERAGHVFMPYHPPRLDGVGERDFDLYRGVMEGVYCFQDMMLGRLIQSSGPDTAFLVLSDRGFHSDHRRPVAPQGTASVDCRREYGIVAMAGPGIRRDELVFGGGLLDIAPTVLALLGLAPGDDMPGRVLTEAFEDSSAPARILTWEDVPGDSGMRQAAPEQDAWEAARVIDELIALGYADPRTDDDGRLAAARRERDFALAAVHFAAGRLADAVPLLEGLVRESPSNRAYRLHLANALYESGRFGECKAIVDPILQEEPSGPLANLLRGKLSVADGDLDRALDCLALSESDETIRASARLAIGGVYLQMRRWDDAERVFRGILQFDPDHAGAHLELARALLGRGLPAEAAASALDSVGLRFDDPMAHYVLGIALAQSGRRARAAGALRTCLALRSDMTPARDALAALGASAA